MFPAGYFAPRYFPQRFFPKIGGSSPGVGWYYARKFFAQRFFAPRYFPSGPAAPPPPPPPPPPAFLIGFNPWPSVLPPFTTAEGLEFGSGPLAHGTDPTSTLIGAFSFVDPNFEGNILVVFFSDGTVRVHLEVPSSRLHTGPLPTNYYNHNIRTVYPQVTTQVSSDVAASSAVLPVAEAGGILPGDTLLISPLLGASVQRNVLSVTTGSVTLTGPILVQLQTGSFVADLDNQT